MTIAHLVEHYGCYTLRNMIDYDIKYGLSDSAKCDTIALVRRLRILGVIK